MPVEVDLKPDCSRCAALCCVAFPFDKGEDFALDKAGNEPCPHLGAGHACQIHTEREAKGFHGCIRYDCKGAGQRVTQELFGGRSWQDEPELLAPMCDAMRRMQSVHSELVMMDTLARLPLTPEELVVYESILSELQPEDGFTPETLADVRIADIRKRLSAFLKELRHHFPNGR